MDGRSDSTKFSYICNIGRAASWKNATSTTVAVSLVTALLQANGIGPRVAQPPNEGVEIIEIPVSPPLLGSPTQSPKAKGAAEEEDADAAAILARERELLVSDVYRLFTLKINVILFRIFVLSQGFFWDTNLVQIYLRIPSRFLERAMRRK